MGSAEQPAGVGNKKSLGLGSPIGLVEVFSALKNISRDRGRLAALEMPGASRGMLLGCGNDEIDYVIRYWGVQYKGQS